MLLEERKSFPTSLLFESLNSIQTLKGFQEAHFHFGSLKMKFISAIFKNIISILLTFELVLIQP